VRGRGLLFALRGGATLGARSFSPARLQPLGYNSRDVLSVEVPPVAAKYPTPVARRALIAQLKEAIGSLPGIQSVAFTSGAPLDDGWGRIFTIDGRERPLGEM